MARVFELPGFPVIIRGIWFRMQVTVTNMFSERGLFFPIPALIYIWFKK